MWTELTRPRPRRLSAQRTPTSPRQTLMPMNNNPTQPPQNTPQAQPKRQFWPKLRSWIWKRLPATFGIFLTLVITSAIGGLYFAFVLMAPRINPDTDLWNTNRETSMVMLDRTGAELMARGARYGEAVSIEELPPYLVKAFIATEDRRFWSHWGVDLRGTLRAAVRNYRSKAVVEGGSTITQQLAKNLFLSPDRTYKRKLREALLAIWLEGHYSKTELLSLYMNRIYLGAGAYGVEAAARTYFDKSARDVTLAEAAMLAGLPKAPSNLAPTQNLLGAEKRSIEVIENLLDINAITAFEAREAKLSPANLASNEVSPELGYAFDYIAAEASRLVGPQDGDLIVTTTLDANMQTAAETALKSALSVEMQLAGAEQAALISYDVDGALRAMVGGRDYRDSQFNRANLAKRQPGSAFKPFVYIAALEAGLSADDRFIDQPIDIDGWAPSNYSGNFVGPVRLTEAIAKSINTVSVQVSEQVGRDKVADVARRVGIDTEFEPHPSIALGAVDLTLEDLTSAYLTLARGGTVVNPYIITEIKNQNNDILYQHKTENSRRVLSREISEGINHLLYQVMLTGTGRRASLGNRDVVGKTGTTNDWRDAWFVGYSAQLVTGVWVGNDDYKPMERITGGSLPAEIWKTFMVAAHRGLPLRSLAGTYPAKTYTADPVLLDFYVDLQRGFSRIARERTRRDRRLRNDNERNREPLRRRNRRGLRRDRSNNN